MREILVVNDKDILDGIDKHGPEAERQRNVIQYQHCLSIFAHTQVHGSDNDEANPVEDLTTIQI